MADEIALNKAVTRAAHAERLLADDLLKEAFDALDRDYLEAWRLTAVRDTDARERLWQAVQIVGKIKDHLSIVAQNGKMAQKELEQITRPEGRKFLGLV